MRHFDIHVLLYRWNVGGDVLEMDPTEYSLSTVEDSELIAVLSFYDHLPAQEAIALKDMLLYDRSIGGSAPVFQRGVNMEFGHCDLSGDPQNEGQSA